MDGLNIPRRREKRISIRNLSRLPIPISYGAITGLIQKIFKYLVKSRESTGVLFLDDKRIKRLNLKYLKANRPTDVLAFRYNKNTADLAISLETAKRNARLYKTSFKKELILYIIHGILHLTGYNDTTPKERKLMQRVQAGIFKKLSRNL